MPKYIDLFVGPTDDQGEVPMVYVHTDAVDLSGFGKRTAPKVSHIRFDDVKQEWYAYLLDGREIARHKNRDIVVETEKHVIDDMFARGEVIPDGFLIVGQDVVATPQQEKFP